ncbi:hypothetical protein EF910_13075 [Streptomyces sp. WAC07149]|uniref:hypothetical protein n=1 Tax=Streptomyces sp. WAC07149 TaxID=2487425 RepID=UPI000F767775|nr:hypothetical protein [Streptomyces sp. WAC07149]RST05364.1 hypothetical protein EF910_13075 [Streptomyces sp. WAC07149]
MDEPLTFAGTSKKQLRRFVNTKPDVPFFAAPPPPPSLNTHPDLRLYWFQPLLEDGFKVASARQNARETSTGVA